MKPSKHTKPAKIIFRNGFSPRAYQTYLELVNCDNCVIAKTLDAVNRCQILGGSSLVSIMCSTIVHRFVDF